MVLPFTAPRRTGRAVGMFAAAATFTGLLAGTGSAAGIAVLTKAQPGLSSAGTSVWHCTYVAENRERTVVFKSACPASIAVE